LEARHVYDYEQLNVNDLPEPLRSSMVGFVKAWKRALKSRTVEDLCNAGELGVGLMRHPTLSQDLMPMTGFARLVTKHVGHCGEYLYEEHRAQEQALPFLRTAVDEITKRKWGEKGDGTLDGEETVFGTIQYAIEYNFRLGQERAAKESRRSWWRR
jgi:hypothetical protein